MNLSDYKNYTNYFVDDDVDLSQWVSQYILRQEAKGTKHFLFLANNNGVYAFDPAVQTKLFPLVTDLSEVTAVAVDGQRKLLFVSNYDEKSQHSDVVKY